jgi:hypothetical protein
MTGVSGSDDIFKEEVDILEENSQPAQDRRRQIRSYIQSKKHLT